MSLPASRRVRLTASASQVAVEVPCSCHAISAASIRAACRASQVCSWASTATPSFSSVQLLATRQQAGRLVTQGIQGGTQSGQLIAARPFVQSLRHTTTLNTATDTFPAEKVLSTSTNTNSPVIHNERFAH